VVSAVKRSIKTADRVFHEFIQTDASINPGNSGGPLLNIDGELIAINTAIHAQAQGIGFAIPINRAKRIVSDLINYGEVVDAWIGLTVQPIDTKLADYLNLKRDRGVIVSDVESKSPAEATGFQEGDIVIAVDGSTITDIASYYSQMKAVAANQTLAFEVIRMGEVRQIRLTTSIFPLDQALVIAKQRLGITVSDLDPDTRAAYGIRSQVGVLIMEMRRGSHLNRIGVRPGDIIRQIGGTRVDNLNDFKSAVVKHRNNQTVVVMIERDGHLYHINATMKAT
jgi:S1-C subfamily serine protease